MLVEKMKKAAKEKNIDVVIEATAENSIEFMAEQSDVILLGPQMAHAQKDLEAEYDKPVAAIDRVDYGMMNGEKVLNTALEMIESSN
jgi:PTS system cellobiose-specific IIB component